MLDGRFAAEFFRPRGEGRLSARACPDFSVAPVVLRIRLATLAAAAGLRSGRLA